MLNKKSNIGPLARPAVYGVAIDDDRAVITQSSTADAGPIDAPVPLRVRMVQLVLSGPRSVADLAQTLGVKEDSVSKAFHRNEGTFFVRVPDGRTFKVGALDRAH
jgi:hypothetical protein